MSNTEPNDKEIVPLQLNPPNTDVVSPTSSEEKQPESNPYIREYSRILGVIEKVRCKAEDYYNYLVTKNLTIRYENYLPLCCIFVASEECGRFISLNKLNKQDETRVFIADFVQIYNQCVSIVDKYSLSDENGSKELSFELVKFCSIFNFYERQKFFKDVQPQFSFQFFWFLFIAIHHRISEKHSDFLYCSCLMSFKLYHNYLIYLQREWEIANIVPFFSANVDFYNESIYKLISSCFKSFRFQQPFFPKMKSNYDYLNSTLTHSNNFIYFQKLLILNPKLLGNYKCLTTVKFMNYSNQTRLKTPIDLMLDFNTTFMQHVEMKKFDVTDGIVQLIATINYLNDDERDRVVNLFYFSFNRIIESETKRLGSNFNPNLLKNNNSFRKSLLFCSILGVIFCDGNFYKCKIKSVLKSVDISFLDGAKIIEIFLKSVPFLGATIKKFFKYVERKFYTVFLWINDKERGIVKKNMEHKIVRRKVYQLIYQKINDLCSLFNDIILKDDIKNVFKIVYYFVNQKIQVIENRSLDLIIMSAIYVFCNKIKKLKIRFRDIMLNYKYLFESIMHYSPIDVTKILFQIKMTKIVIDTINNKETRTVFLGDIVNFYNTIFISVVKSIVLKLNTIKLPDDLVLIGGNKGTKINLTPRRRKRLYNTNLYLSSRIISPHKLTPRTKKLYSFGEYRMEKGQGNAKKMQKLDTVARKLFF